MNVRRNGAMQLRKRQMGMGALGWLSVLGIASFALTCFFRLGPIYLEYWQAKKAIEIVIYSSGTRTLSNDQLLTAIEKQLNVSTIEAITRKDITITSSKGERQVDATYEKRVPLIANIDVVVKFDKLVYNLSSSD